MSAMLFIIMSRQRDLVDRFRDAAATAPANAKSLQDLGVRRSFMVSRMIRAGVFAPAGDDLWWLDAVAWDHFRERQTSRLLTAAVVIIAAVSLGVAIAILR